MLFEVRIDNIEDLVLFFVLILVFKLKIVFIKLVLMFGFLDFEIRKCKIGFLLIVVLILFFCLFRRIIN